MLTSAKGVLCPPIKSRNMKLDYSFVKFSSTEQQSFPQLWVIHFLWI